MKIHVIQDGPRVSKADEIVEQVFPAAFPWDGIRRNFFWIPLFYAFHFSSFIASRTFNFPFFFMTMLIGGLFFAHSIFSDFNFGKVKISDQCIRFGYFMTREILEIKNVKCEKITIQFIQYPIFARTTAIYIGNAKVNGKGVYIHSTRIRGEVIQIEYKGRFLIISPADPDGFLQAIEATRQSPAQSRAL